MSRTPKKLPKGAKKVFTGTVFDVYQWEQKLFDGTTKLFERVTRPDTVSVIAVTPDKKIVIIKEEQPGKNQCTAIPGGRVDENEDLMVAAQRELLEETGYRADRLELFTQIEPVSKMDWTVYTYVARNCTKIKEPHLDGGEKIETHLVTFDEFVHLADDNTFNEPEFKLLLLKTLYSETEKTKLEKLLLN